MQMVTDLSQPSLPFETKFVFAFLVLSYEICKTLKKKRDVRKITRSFRKNVIFLLKTLPKQCKYIDLLLKYISCQWHCGSISLARARTRNEWECLSFFKGEEGGGPCVRFTLLMLILFQSLRFQWYFALQEYIFEIWASPPQIPNG